MVELVAPFSAERRLCEVPGCQNVHVANGLCRTHYMRVQRHGTTELQNYQSVDAEWRFWNYVDRREDDDCWEWKASKAPGGYGQFKANGKEWLAHRFSYSTYVDTIPEGMYVCHHCDNPSCVNPSHLFVGTQFDNMQDMYEKGRRKRASGRTQTPILC